jgi:hypothetical protein
VALTLEQLEAVDVALRLPLTVRRARSGEDFGIVVGKRPSAPIHVLELKRIVARDAVGAWDMGDSVQAVSATAMAK